MYAQVFSAFAWGLYLATIAASAPTVLNTSEDCATPSITTVFVTVSASIEPMTVYVTTPVSSVDVDMSEAPRTTLTRYAAFSSTTNGPSTVSDHISAASYSLVANQDYVGSTSESTITEQVTISVNDVNVSLHASGLSVTYSDTPASGGLLYYVVENGTTYWFGGQTPAPYKSYVFSTSSITVEPIYASASSSDEAIHTLTVQSTLYITAQFTLTETLNSLSSSSGQGAIFSASAATGLPYTSSPGGWNATKTLSGSGVLSGAIALSSATAAGNLAYLGRNLSLYSSSSIYETSHSTTSKSYLAAQSVFGVLRTSALVYTNASTTASDPKSATSLANLDLTTAAFDNKTLTQGISYGSAVKTLPVASIETPFVSNPIGAPNVNGTCTTSVRVTSVESGVLSSQTSSSSTTVHGSSSASVFSTTSTTSVLAGAQLLSLVGLSTSSPRLNISAGPGASLTHTLLSSVLGYISSSQFVNTPNASSSAIYFTKLPRPLTFSTRLNNYSSSVVISTAASSALGALTSRSSPSTSDDCTTSTASPHTSVEDISKTLSAASSAPNSSKTSTEKLVSSFSLLAYSSSFLVVSSIPVIASATFTSAAMYSSISEASSSLSTKISTNVSSITSATPTSCGERGNFVLNFDDVPTLAIGDQIESTVQPEPVFNPYHQFDFSDGFTIVPPPKAPYNASSPSLFVEFIPNFNINGTNKQIGPNTAEGGYNGQISDGDFDETGCFRFQIYGASMGCDSTGPACDFTFTGYRLDSSRNEIMVAAQSKAVPACPALINCSLTIVDLDSTFTNLAFVRINVTVAGKPKIWWMDDLRLGWYDNSCAKGLCRQTTPVH